MSRVPLVLPIGPESVRAFIGYRQPSLSTPEFWNELGRTFMPGTPYMQAPLGLAAYVPTVLDPPEESGLPDEVALIVYASLKVYQDARENSLRRRVYTHSHAGVFDMGREGGGGQFPGPPSAPSRRDDRLCWYLFDRAIDWQTGSTRLLFLQAEDGHSIAREDLVEETTKSTRALEGGGIDQLIGIVTGQFAAIWLHSSEERELPGNAFGLVPSGTILKRDLPSVPIPMPNLDEEVEIEGPTTFCFRFVRELHFFL